MGLPRLSRRLVDDLASLQQRERKKKKTPHSDNTIVPPPKTIDNDKKTTLTSDNASTHPTLPPTLLPASMFYCEQLAGGTLRQD